MTSESENPVRTCSIVLGLIAATVAFALFLSVHIITTGLGYETVLVSQPILGDYEVKPHALKPGRSLQFTTVHGVPVKTGKMHFNIRYTDYPRTRGPDSIQVKLVVRSNDPVELVSRFGEFWYTDHVEDVLRQAVTSVVSEYYRGAPIDSPVFQNDFNRRLRAVIQQKFKGAGIPLNVFTASGEYTTYHSSSGFFRARNRVAGQGIRYE